MNKTNIEYLDYTWNVTHGCSPISPGCSQCWAEATSHRLAGMNVRGYSKENPFAVTCCPWKLDEPLKIKKPSRIGVSFMGDLFHEDVGSDFIDQVFQVIALSAEEISGHQFLILTKRPDRMRKYYKSLPANFYKQYPNLWLGVTAENQEQADKRIPILLQIPAAKRFVSIEPMLGRMNITKYLEESGYESGGAQGWITTSMGFDHVILGGESGPKARPLHPDWVRSIRDQCVATGTPFFFKQWGEWSLDSGDYSNLPYGEFHGMADWVESCRCVEGTQEMVRIGKKRAGYALDGRQWREYPS